MAMNWLFTVLICFLSGAGAGLGTGFAGMSAAAVISPMLTAFLQVPAYKAIGIGLLSDVLASAVSAYTYKKSGNLNIKDSLPLLISVLCMTAAGSFIAKLMPERAMNNTMQIAMIMIGLRFLLKPVKAEKKDLLNEAPKKRILKAVIGGIAVGFICGFVGAGGGMMLLFVLTSFLGYPMHMAVGTSVFIMTFTALTGGISHLLAGGIPNPLTLCLCVIFTLLWARIAAKIANRVSAKVLNRVVGVILIATSAVILSVTYLS